MIHVISMEENPILGKMRLELLLQMISKSHAFLMYNLSMHLIFFSEKKHTIFERLIINLSLNQTFLKYYVSKYLIISREEKVYVCRKK